MIADPWGRVLAKAGSDAAVLTADLDMEALAKIRTNMPLMDQRRMDGESVKPAG